MTVDVPLNFSSLYVYGMRPVRCGGGGGKAGDWRDAIQGSRGEVFTRMSVSVCPGGGRGGGGVFYIYNTMNSSGGRAYRISCDVMKSEGNRRSLDAYTFNSTNRGVCA